MEIKLTLRRSLFSDVHLVYAARQCLLFGFDFLNWLFRQYRYTYLGLKQRFLTGERHERGLALIKERDGWWLVGIPQTPNQFLLAKINVSILSIALTCF